MEIQLICNVCKPIDTYSSPSISQTSRAFPGRSLLLAAHTRDPTGGANASLQQLACAPLSATRAISALSHTHIYRTYTACSTDRYSIDPHTRCCAFFLAIHLYYRGLTHLRPPPSDVVEIVRHAESLDDHVFGLHVVPHVSFLLLSSCRRGRPGMLPSLGHCTVFVGV